MDEKHVEIKTDDGVMETFVARPLGAGPLPVVIIYMDAPGIREELRNFARRIAGQGYHCLLPDLYYRGGRVRFDLNQRDEAMIAEIFKNMRSLNNALVLQDTAALLRALEGDESATGARACIGYCMSGQYVLSVAGTYPEDFAAAVSCYGVGIVTDKPDSPHLLADKVKGELFFAFAENDEYVDDSEIETLKATLSEHKVASQVKIYQGTQHGFCFPERAAMYVESAAEDVWRISFELFDRQLR